MVQSYHIRWKRPHELGSAGLSRLPHAHRRTPRRPHPRAHRRARKLLAGEHVAYARKDLGRRYTPAIARGRAAPHVELVCGDALDPPLVHAMYDRVVALNVLDSVRSPRQLLAVADGLCKVGGEVILSTPYSFQTSITPAREQLLEIPLPGYTIEDEADLTWTLRRDAR